MMSMLEVGKPFPVALGGAEAVYMEADAAGFMLICAFPRPTQAEIAAFSANQPFEIRYTVMDDIFYFTAKPGSLNWLDASFAPWLSPKYKDLVIPQDESQGSLLTVVLVDSSTNTIKALRGIGLGHKFSVDLVSKIHEVISRKDANPISMAEYQQMISTVLRNYSTKDLVQRATARYKVH